MFYHLFQILLITIMAWTRAHREFVSESFLRLANPKLLHGDPFVLLSCYVRMMLMLFRRENRYCYGLNISEPQIHHLKESHLEEVKNAIRQKVTKNRQTQLNLGKFKS